MNSLTTTQSKRLAELEIIIEDGLTHFLAVGHALAEIRDSQLYEPHATFQEYCSVRWEMSRQHAGRLINAAAVFDNIKLHADSGMEPIGYIPDNGDSKLPLPKHEGQLRPLAGLEPEEQREAWSEAVESAGGKMPTAEQVNAAANGQKPTKKEILCPRCERITPVSGCHACRDLRAEKAKAKKDAKRKDLAEPTEILDAFKNPVPKRCLPAWSDPWLPGTIDLLVETLSKLRKEKLGIGMQKRSAHYPFIKSKDVIDGLGFVDNYLDQVIEHLKEHRPAGVCPSCAGAGCADCQMKGLVPRAVYKALKEKAK